MAEKILNTRIALKIDTLENWGKSTLPLKKGELALATVAASAGTGLTEPVIMIKVGEDGVKTFKDLEWNVYAKAADVLAACKTEAGLKEFVNGVIADAGIATNEAMEALAGRVATVEGDLNAENTGIKARMTVAEGAIDALEALVGDTKVADQITTAIDNHTHSFNDLTDKPFYDESTLEEVFAQNVTFTDGKLQGQSLDSIWTNNETYIVTIDGVSQTGVAIMEGNPVYGWWFFFDGGWSYKLYLYADDISDGEHFMQIQKVNQNLKQIDEKFIPDTIARAEDVPEIDFNLSTTGKAADAGETGRAIAKKANQTALDEAIEALEGADESQVERITALEAKFGDGEGNVEGQIAAAVAAEAKLREEADAALQEQVTANADAIADLEELVGDEKVSTAIENAVKVEKERAEGIEGGLETRLAAVEGDYLKAADKEALQNQINTIMNNPDAEGAINSINEFTTYVTEHGTIADGMRTDINKNKEDIAAEVQRATGVEGGLDTRLKAVEAMVSEDGAVKSDIADALAEAKGYTDTEVKELADGAVKTNADNIAALDALVGDTAVATQITNVTNPLDERIVALEAVDHEHANKSELDKIADGDKAKWDAKVDDVTAAADSGLKATRTGNAIAIEIDDSITFVFDCGNSGVTA